MSALPPLRLQTYRADWELNWRAASARFERVRSVVQAAQFNALPETVQRARQTEFEICGISLGEIFETQFETTDAYRDWALKWLDIHLGWRPESGFNMPSGLPIHEIKRRLAAVRASRPAHENGACEPHKSRALEILSGRPSPDVEAQAARLRAVGGDHLGFHWAAISKNQGVV
jgi:hypothetical protein